MDLDSLTVGEIKSIQKMFGCSEPEQCLWRVGEKYLIRTVTHYYTGRLKAVTDKELLLENAAWIADTKRFYDTLTKGEFNEVEPFNTDVIVGRGAVVDAAIWKHDLPKDQQ